MDLMFCSKCGSEISVHALSCPACGAPVRMSPYERSQAAEIWKLKNSPPGILSHAVNAVSAPLGWIIRQVIPDKAIMAALSAANLVARSTSNEKSILGLANVSSVEELKNFDLERNDALADQSHDWAIATATAEGAVTGAAGIFGVVPDIAAICTIALRAVHRIGLTYGYKIKTQEDERFCHAVLSSVSANTLKERIASLATLRSLQMTLVRRTWAYIHFKALQNRMSQEAALITLRQLAKQIGINLTKRRALAAIPVIGIAVGASMNGWYIREVGWAARRAFQERRLVEKGIIMGIPYSDNLVERPPST